MNKRKDEIWSREGKRENIEKIKQWLLCQGSIR